MNTKLYEVQFSCTLVVAARSKRQALDNATRLMDNPLCYPTNIRDAIIYPDILNESELDEYKPDQSKPEEEQPLPF